MKNKMKVGSNTSKIQVARNLKIQTSDFTLEELHKVTNPLSKKKKMGLDNIPNIIWKDPKFHELHLENCNYVLNSFDAPEL